MEQENQLQIFNNDEFGQVKVIKNEEGEPLFELYSVGTALGYSRIKTVKGKEYQEIQKSRIDTVMKNGSITGLPHGVETYLTEDMLYDFIFESKTAKSKPFRKWVTSDVLPTLRKTGYYNLHNHEENTNEYLKIEPSKLEQKVIELFDNLNDKTSELGEYFRPKHKTKLAFNKFIKDCLGDNATKKNCKKAKDMFIMILGNGEYTIYEDIPLDRIKNTNALATLYDICKNINISINKGIEIK